MVLASWFPQITVDDTNVFTTRFITWPFQVLSITNLAQVYTTARFCKRAKRPARSVHKHRVILLKTEAFINIAPGEYLFYSSDPQTIQIQCKSGTKHIAVQSSKKITLENNCEIRSKQFVTKTGHNFHVESPIRKWPSNWNASGLLFNLDSLTLAAHVNNLKLIHYPATPARDLHQLMQSKSDKKFWVTTVSILAIILILIFLYLAYRYCQLRKMAVAAGGG